MCETVVLLTHDLQTDESIGKQRNPTQKVVLIFWQPQIDNIRTEISLYEAEIMETLDLLEKFLNDLKH